jgi:hypothetical protein
MDFKRLEETVLQDWFKTFVERLKAATNNLHYVNRLSRSELISGPSENNAE